MNLPDHHAGQQAMIDLAEVKKVALGPWTNEATFWVGLVERRKLYHLGEPIGDVSGVRNRHALGPLVFGRDRPSSLAARFVFIKERTKAFLQAGRLERICFDLTTMRPMSAFPGDGFFAFHELRCIVEDANLLRITSFYEEGALLRRSRDRLRSLAIEILEGKTIK